MTRPPSGQQRDGTGWYRISAQANGPSRIDLYDQIGYFGITAQDFLAELNAVTGDVEVHVNSPGGDVFEAYAIYTALASRPGVTTVVDSLAASAASLIVMAGEQRLAAKASQLMVHDAWAGMDGNAEDLQRMVARLEATSQQIAGVYADTAGGTADHWRGLMKAETWFTPEQALEAGLITGIQESARVPATAAAASGSAPAGTIQGTANPPAADAAGQQDGTGDEPGSGTADQDSAAAAPAPNGGTQDMPDDTGVLTIEARRTRITEIGARLNAIAADHPASTLPSGLQAEWINLVGERDGHQEALASVEARNADLAAGLAATGAPAGDRQMDDDGRPSARASGIGGQRRQAPAFIPAHDIFDMGAIRQQARSPEELPGLYRDNALRAIEQFRFPGAPNREQAQANMARLLSTIKDDTEGFVAQRVLRTGNPAYVRAFGKALARGNPGALTGEDARILALGESDSGSYAVPVELDPTINLTSNGSVNPIRKISRVEQITTKEFDLVTSLGVTVTRKAEFAASTDNSPVLNQPTLKPNRVDGFIPFSMEIEGDWTGLQAQMAMLVADAKDVEEAHAFTLGTGVAPDAGGVISTMDSGSNFNGTGGSGALGIDDAEQLAAAVPPRFNGQASFMANRVTYTAYRKLFGAQAGFATDPWNRPSQGMPPTLWGYDAYEASDMVSTHATGDKPLVCGDFKRGYLIVDRVGMNIEMIPQLFRQQTAGSGVGYPTGTRGYYCWWRNNAMVLIPNAFRVLVVQ